MSKIVKTIASVALPIVGTIVAPGIGTYLGSAVGSLGLSTAAMGAIGGGLGGIVGSGISSNWNPTQTILGGVTGGAGGYFAQGGTLAGLTGSAAEGAGGAANGAAGAATATASNTPMTVVTNGLPSTSTAALQTAAPAASTSALGTGLVDSIASNLPSASKVVPALLGAGNQVTTQLGVDAASEAAKQQQDAINAAIAQQSPYTQAGADALAQIQKINADPSTYIQSNPLYKTLANDAQSRLLANAAAKGKAGSGGTAAALQDNLLQIGNGLVQQQLGNLQTVAGAGQSAANNVSNLTVAGGNSAAAGTIGSSNAITNGYQNQINTLLALQGLNKSGSYSPSISLRA